MRNVFLVTLMSLRNHRKEQESAQNQRVLSSRREACDESTEGITLPGMRTCLVPIF